MIAGPSFFFFFSYEICCVYLRQNDNFEFQLTADEKIQAAIASRKDSCFWLLATATRWSRSTSNFYALIGQKLIGEFKLVYFDSWRWHSFVSSCDVFNCLFLLDVPNETELLTRLFCVIHGWFVYCAFGFEMHSLSKSLEIRFRMASFSKKISLLTCPCLRRTKRVEKSQAILAWLDDLQEQHLDC